jgi:type IV pilus assembly protein PilC
MPSFAYRAVSPSGHVSRGKIEAANENELVHYLNQSGLELIDARVSQRRSFAFPMTRRRVSRRDLAAFCASVHDQLKAGIAFPDALDNIRISASSRPLGDTLALVSRAISEGGRIAGAFAGFPNVFSPLFVAIVSAGEESGDMTAAFGYLAASTSNDAILHERLRRVLRYPLFLLVTAGAAVGFMMTMVVPQVVQFLSGLGGQLPVATRVLVWISSALSEHGLKALLGLALLIIAAQFARCVSTGFALMIDHGLLSLPVIGPIILKTSVARFAHSFSILFRSGCSLAKCLNQAGETVTNSWLRQQIAVAENLVMEGKALSVALDGVFPPFALGLLKTGERTGNLEKSLTDLSAAYTSQAEASIDEFIAMLEPALTLAIGAVLAWTVLAVLGPLYGSLSVLGRI